MSAEPEATTSSPPAKKSVEASLVKVPALDAKETMALLDHLKYKVASASLTLMGKKVDAFKGKYFLEVLKTYKKGKYSDEKVALTIATRLLHAKHFITVVKNPDKFAAKNKLLPVKNASGFNPKGRYVWLYEGNKTWNNAFTAAIIVGFFLMCLFPIWPRFCKVGVWYICVTILLVFFLFTALRGVIFGLGWLVGYDVWVLPNIFDEELSVSDSFKPVLSVEKAGGTLPVRAGLILALALFGYWVYQQPTEFDGYVQAQRDFLDDLYSGALLSDRSQEDMDNIDRIIPLEELMRMEEEEKAAAAAAAAAAAEADLTEEELVEKLLEEAIEEDIGGDDDVGEL